MLLSDWNGTFEYFVSFLCFSALCLSVPKPIKILCICCFCTWMCVSVNELLHLCLFTIGLPNWLVVTTNRQQSPHHRLLPQRGKRHGNGGGWSRPQPTLPQRLPPQSAAVMETAVASGEPHTPGVRRALRPGGGWERSVQVKQWDSEIPTWLQGRTMDARRTKGKRGSVDELQAAVKGESQMRGRVNDGGEVTKNIGKVYGLSSWKDVKKQQEWSARKWFANVFTLAHQQ